MRWCDDEPRFGDIIRTKVSFYYHYGIFVSEDEVVQFGLPTDVSRPANEVRVLTSDIYAFLNGGTLEVGIPEKEDKATLRAPSEIVALAKSRIGEDGYDILHNNCEHFVTDCAFGKSSSFLDAVREKLRKKLGK